MRTANELALLFAEIEDPKRSSADRQNVLARRLRHFSQAGLIKSTGQPRDKRGTEQFDIEAACAARILSECADFGIVGELLRDVAERLAPKATGTLEGRTPDGQRFSKPYWGEPTEKNTVPPANHIAHLPARIASGDKWELRLRLMVQYSHRSLSGGLCPAGDVETAVPEWAVVLKHQNIRQVGQITFDVSELCGPLVATFEA